MNLIKKFLVMLIAILLVVPIANVYAEGIEDTTDDDGENEAGDGTGSAWIYANNYLGARFTLYQYDGETLIPLKTIDFVNNPDSVGETILATTNRQTRLFYTHLGNKVGSFTSQNRNLKKLSDYGINYTFDISFGSSLATKLVNYFGDDSNTIINKLENMFEVEISKSNFSDYYIVIEAATAFYNRPTGTYIYGTGYEIINQISQFDTNGYTGTYQYDLSTSQAVTFANYLYESVYVKKDNTKLNKYSCQKGNSYDCNNFVNGTNNEGGLITVVTGTSKEFSNVNDIKNSGYDDADFPYGLTVLWVGEKGGCTTVCDGKTGDNLLQCAEKFCSEDETIKSKGEKADCIKNQCNYKFEPLKCDNDKVTSGNNTVCSSQTTSTKKTCDIVDGNQYFSYKVECTINSTVQYPDTLPTTLNPTEGFKYQTFLYGNKSCTIVLDEELWKFNYASSYTLAERDNYLDAIVKYNNLKLSYPYDSSNSNMTININEKINEKNKVTTKELEAEEKYNSGSNKTYVTSTKKTIKSYNNATSVSKQINVYKTDSSNGTYYHLPNVCISDKDRYTIIEKNVCDNEFGPYKEYFTDANSDNGKNNTKTSVVHNVAGLDVDNTCNYIVTDNDPELSCSINLTNSNVTVLSDGETILYNGNPLNFKLTVDNRYNLTITQSITTSLGKNCGSDNCVITKNDFATGEYLTITGTINYNGQKITCSKNVVIIPETNLCKFTITKDEVNNETTIKINPINVTGAKYSIKQLTSEEWMNTNTITISNDSYNEIIGRITLPNGTIYTDKDCYYEINKDKTCLNLFEPVEYQKIKEYCDEHWREDTAGYNSSNDCYIQCTRGKNTCKTQFKCHETNKIKQYCTTSYLNDGYKSVEDCINDCNCGGIKYAYRPISLTDPFPNREANWNWLGYEKYITDDVDDLTPSTGDTPEYEIVLNKERIQTIKKNTKKYNSTDGNDAYTDYVREDDNTTGEYKSKFINVSDTKDGGFRTYFTFIDGVKVS